MEIIKSNWKEFIENLKTSYRIVLGGIVIDLSKINWERSFGIASKTSSDLREIEKITSSKIQFKNLNKNETTNLDIKGSVYKIQKLENGILKTFFIIKPLGLIYFTEVAK